MRDALGLGEPRGSVTNARAEGGGGPWRGPEPGAGYPPQQAGYPPQTPARRILAAGLRHRRLVPRQPRPSTAAGARRRRAPAQRHPLECSAEHSGGGHGSQAFDNVSDHRGSPWSGSAADSQLARDAGIDHIGNSDCNLCGPRTRPPTGLAGDHYCEQDAQQDLADDDAQQATANKTWRTTRILEATTTAAATTPDLFCSRRRQCAYPKTVAYHFRSQETSQTRPICGCKSAIHAFERAFTCWTGGCSGVWNKRCEQEP